MGHLSIVVMAEKNACSFPSTSTFPLVDWDVYTGVRCNTSHTVIGMHSLTCLTNLCIYQKKKNKFMWWDLIFIWVDSVMLGAPKYLRLTISCTTKITIHVMHKQSQFILNATKFYMIRQFTYIYEKKYISFHAFNG